MHRYPMHIFRSGWRISLLVLLISGLGACQTFPAHEEQAINGVTAMSTATVSAPPPIQKSNPQAYRVGPGDVLSIKFLYNPELNEKLPALPDGSISLQLINDVQVAGRTVKELREEIEKRYQPYINRPTVSINVIEFQSYKVYVGGEVGSPTILPLHHGMTVRQAIIMAGGSLNTGALDSVLLIRDPGNGQPEVHRINLEKGLMSKQMNDRESARGISNELVLLPRDVVYVPRTTIASVNLFVEQYLSRMIPSWAVLQVTYNKGALRTK